MLLIIPYSRYIGHSITQNKAITDVQTGVKQSILVAKNIQSTFPTNKPIDDIDKFSALFQCGNISMKNFSKIGEGSYGVAYRFGNYVVKIPKDADDQAPSYATCKRTSRILNEVNGSDFSRPAFHSETGQHVLITKFVDGEDADPLEAFDFIKSRQRIIHDFYVPGNVKKNQDGKLYLIDADQVTYSYQNRRNSAASEEFYNDYEFFRSIELVIPKRIK